MTWEARISLRDWDLGEPDPGADFVTIRSDTFNAAQSDSYPATKQGITFGQTGPYFRESGTVWTLLGRNALLCAAVRINNSAPFSPGFRIDLPSPGTYEVAGAFGNPHQAFVGGHFAIQDGVSTIYTTTDTRATATHVRDIAGVLRPIETWESDPGWVTLDFAESYCTVVSLSDEAMSAFWIRQIGGDEPTSMMPFRCSALPL